MKEALNFVKGAIAKNSDLPQLTHFQISDGFIRSFNGIVTLCAPIPLNITAAPEAITFVRAIDACNDTTTISLKKGNKLIVKSGGFRATIECLPDIGCRMLPEGVKMAVTGPVIDVLKKLRKIVPSNSQNAWNRGMLFDGQFINVTNNKIIVQHWLPYSFPKRVNVPEHAIKELIRINEAPVSVQVAARSITFNYTDGRWLKTRLLDDRWPKNVDEMLSAKAEPVAIPNEFFDCIEKLKYFVDEIDCIAINGDGVSAVSNGETAASFDITGLCCNNALISAQQLLLIMDIAQSIDLKLYPKPIIFYGDNLRGLIAGLSK